MVRYRIQGPHALRPTPFALRPTPYAPRPSLSALRAYQFARPGVPRSRGQSFACEHRGVYQFMDRWNGRLAPRIFQLLGWGVLAGRVAGEFGAKAGLVKGVRDRSTRGTPTGFGISQAVIGSTYNPFNRTLDSCIVAVDSMAVPGRK